MSSSKKRWKDFYLHLILICVKCTIFLLEKSSFFLLSPALVPLLSSYMKILILSPFFSPFSLSKLFANSIYQIRNILFAAWCERRKRNEKKNSFNFTSNSVQERSKNRHGYFTIRWCTSKSFHPFSLLSSHFLQQIKSH